MPIIDQNVNGSQSKSVLNKFSISCGKDVALTVIKQIASTFSIAQPTEPSPLTTDQEVCVVIKFDDLRRRMIKNVSFPGTLVHGRHLLRPVIAVD